MVKIIYPLAVSPEYEELKEQFAQLSGEYSELITRYQELCSTIIPNVGMEYMLKIGRREHQLFTRQVELQQLKREISLYQAARNRGERLSQAEVAKTIREEFNAYQQQLREQEQQIKEAEKRFGYEKMSQEDSVEFRKLYLDLVKKLHPDLHSDLPPQASTLWHQVMKAYQQNNLPELTLLTEMAAEMLKHPEIQAPSEDAISGFREKLAKVTRKKKQLQERLQELQQVPPLSYVELLADANKVLNKRTEIKNLLESVEKQILALQKVLTQLRGS